jgi:hypothetical protein
LRFRLVLLTACSALLAVALPARAEDALVLRGNYWRDRNTRVIAPEASFSKELPSGTTVGAGYLLDAITSASQASGVLSDQPFTELRNQLSLSLGQRIGPVTARANYRYSAEGDYWAHTGGGTVAVDLFQKNLALSLTYARGHDEVARRASAIGTIPLGHLDTNTVILGASAVITPWMLLDLSYDYAKLGDANDVQSFQANAYRVVKVSGTQQREVVPRERTRHALTAGLRVAVPERLGPLKYLTFYLKYKLYADSWGVVGHAPELRTYLRLGPVELRITGRYYTQSAATFWPRDGAGNPLIVPEYNATPMMPEQGKGLKFADCTCVTGDAKLGQFHSFFSELRLAFPVGRALAAISNPLGDLLGDSILSVSGGYYVNDLAAWAQFGNAAVAGIEVIIPL